MTARYRRKKQSEWPHILLFYVLPFIVFNSILFFCLTTKPKLSVVVEDTNDYLSTNVVLTVKSFFPTKSVSMTLDGEPLELEKADTVHTPPPFTRTVLSKPPLST